MISTLDARCQRARKDRTATLLAGAGEAGVRFRWVGSDLLLEGLERLPLADQVYLARHLPEISARLADQDNGEAPLAELGIDAVELITDAERARAAISTLPQQVGFDIETEAADGYAVQRPWLLLTRQGVLAKRQPRLMDKTALNPRKARPRLAQIYDPTTRTVFVIDLHRVSLEALVELWQRRLVVHNAGFELTMLGAQGISLPNVIDTQQLAGLVLGCATGVRKLGTVSAEILGVPISKTEQLSDWSAPRLSKNKCTTPRSTPRSRSGPGGPCTACSTSSGVVASGCRTRPCPS